ncbi:MAG: P27 family phage terminase small subunit [Chelatococcus sp.]|uniref:P27 family phage terminase small subunit n=1 Tax=Chelatococcus sp. TaxID=1953771 RepID=UPI0025C08C34|nr:P27 family phage terminase small subunit [Chelatococcus sp.]MBX3537327.1 P27 family phage terminase small subunit [Chelatococcus sp.]
MNVIGIDGTGDIVPEPDWSSLFNDELEILAAKEHWRRVTTELKDRTLMAPGNAHGLQRLVVSYVLYDRALRTVAEKGPVEPPKRGSKNAIARLSPFFVAMREMASDAATLEAEFGLAPRRRAAATKADNGKKTQRAADRFLRSIS